MMANGDEDKKLSEEIDQLLREKDCYEESIKKLIDGLPQPQEVYDYLQQCFIIYASASTPIKKAFFKLIFQSQDVFTKYKNRDFKDFFLYLQETSKLNFTVDQQGSIAYVFFHRPTFAKILYEALKILSHHKNLEGYDVNFFIKACKDLLNNIDFQSIHYPPEEDSTRHVAHENKEDLELTETESEIDEEGNKIWKLSPVLENSDSHELETPIKFDDPIYKMTYAISNLYYNELLTSHRYIMLCENPEASHAIDYIVHRSEELSGKTKQEEKECEVLLEQEFYKNLQNHEQFLQACYILFSTMKKRESLSNLEEPSFKKLEHMSYFDRFWSWLTQPKEPQTLNDVTSTISGLPILDTETIVSILQLMLTIADKKHLEPFCLGVVTLKEMGRLNSTTQALLKNNVLNASIVVKLIEDTPNTPGDFVALELDINDINSAGGDKNKAFEELLEERKKPPGLSY